MKVITKSEALEALKNVSRGDERYSIVGEPDHLVGQVSVFFVRIWDGEDVNWDYVMFNKKNGKVKVYEGR
jgi:hypothetical protein